MLSCLLCASTFKWPRYREPADSGVKKERGSLSDLLSKYRHTEGANEGSDLFFVAVTFNVQRPWPFTLLLLLFFCCSIPSAEVKSWTLVAPREHMITGACAQEYIYSAELGLYQVIWKWLDMSPERRVILSALSRCCRIKCLCFCSQR